jgi:polar amino acid transport system substrate-binding protein
VSRHASIVITVLVLSGLALRAPAETPPLRICADPDDLPFTSSDPTDRGLYLELAEVIAGRMGAKMEPVFFRTDAGMRALRPTLIAGRCDAFFGLPFTDEGSAGKSIRLTRPFLEVGYAVVLPPAMAFARLSDLDGKRVGVQYASTPQTILSVRDSVRLVTFRFAEEAVDALGRGEIDAAFVWGPVAGWHAARRGLLGRFRIVSVSGLDLRAKAAVGVRADDEALRERLDREIVELGPAIRALAAKYHFPLDAPVELGAPAAGLLPAPAAPTPANGRVNPFSGDAVAVAAGRTEFNVRCSHCHSPNAASPDPVRDLRLLNHRYGARVNDVFYETVTQGRPTKGMPTWGPILDDQTIWRIKAFLETVQKKDAD